MQRLKSLTYLMTSPPHLYVYVVLSLSYENPPRQISNTNFLKEIFVNLLPNTES